MIKPKWDGNKWSFKRKDALKTAKRRLRNVSKKISALQTEYNNLLDAIVLLTKERNEKDRTTSPTTTG